MSTLRPDRSAHSQPPTAERDLLCRRCAARAALTQCGRIQHASFESSDAARLTGENVFVLADEELFAEHLKQLARSQRARDCALRPAFSRCPARRHGLCLPAAEHSRRAAGAHVRQRHRSHAPGADAARSQRQTGPGQLRDPRTEPDRRRAQRRARRRANCWN